MIELKEPAVMERIDMTLRRFGLSPISRASIRSAVKNEILKTVNETIETVKLIDIVIIRFRRKKAERVYRRGKHSYERRVRKIRNGRYIRLTAQTSGKQHRIRDIHIEKRREIMEILSLIITYSCVMILTVAILLLTVAAMKK